VPGLDYTFDIDTSKLMKAMDAFPVEVSKTLRQNLEVSLRGVASDAQRSHRFVSHGHLENAIKTKVLPSSGIEGVVYISGRIAPYGAMVHDGTKPHTIKAKNKKTLHFVTHGAERFPRLVHHPGTKPDRFLTDAFRRQRPLIDARMHEAVKTAIQIAGLK
jgi:hypothetical protein